ncbi:hypothetical protein [Kineococcus sp. R86509]|uniref:hypothetical protein n=1 Tax=Kineococcus sp. R86509 TaxID=3093851 RepID=UPI0036D3750C
MPFLINTVLRRWLLTTVAIPLVASGARRLARRLEARRGGATTVTRGLTRAADTVERDRRDADTGTSARRRGLLRGRR